MTAAERIAALHALLRTIEWQGDTVHFTCPACGRDKQHGHNPDCELARALADEKKLAAAAEGA